MSDLQRKKLLRAETDVWRRGKIDTGLNPPLTEQRVTELADEVCVNHASGLVTVEFKDVRSISIRNGQLTVPPWAMRPLTVLHEITHQLTDRVFPPHGAEFAERLLSVLRGYSSPALADELRGAFEHHGVHFDAKWRQERVHRAARNAANMRPGVLADLVLADPPERIVGALAEYDGKDIVIDGVEYPLERARYLDFIG